MTKKQRELLKRFNELHAEIAAEDSWLIPDADTVLVFKWLVMNEYTDLNDADDLRWMYDNDDPNTEVLCADNIDDYFVADIKRLTNHTKEYFVKHPNIGYILHYPRIREGYKTSHKFIYSSCIRYNVNDLNDKPKTRQRRFVVLGCKYFDSPNGNTYHNARIYDTKTDKEYYCGYQYGYWDAYMYSALEYIKENIDKRATMSDLHNIGYVKACETRCKSGQF